MEVYNALDDVSGQIDGLEGIKSSSVHRQIPYDLFRQVIPDNRQKFKVFSAFVSCLSNRLVTNHCRCPGSAIGLMCPCVCLCPEKYPLTQMFGMLIHLDAI